MYGIWSRSFIYYNIVCRYFRDDLYKKITHTREELLPLTTVEFEGVQFTAPANVQKFLVGACVSRPFIFKWLFTKSCGRPENMYFFCKQVILIYLSYPFIFKCTFSHFPIKIEIKFLSDKQLRMY